MGRKKKYTDEEIKEHNRERARRYYVLHREEMMRRNRDWRKANPDRIKVYRKRQREKRRASQYNYEYYRKNREEMKRRNRDWRMANPEKVKGYNDKQKKLRRIEAERKKLERTKTRETHFYWHGCVPDTRSRSSQRSHRQPCRRQSEPLMDEKKRRVAKS